MKMGLIERCLTAARADSIPAGESGLWYVNKLHLTHSMITACALGDQRLKDVPPGNYTQLFRWTESTMHLVGELVMHDYPAELNKHLEAMLRARGHVLVTGLGLGCVVRGMLANPAAEHIACIEASKSVLELVAPHMPTDRLTIIHADALKWCKRTKMKFDCAWHDIWSDESSGEPHLQLLHGQLIAAMGGKVKEQSAWEFPRMFRRAYREVANCF